MRRSGHSIGWIVAERALVPAGATLALSGCFSSNLDAFNVLALDLQGTTSPLTIEGKTHPKYINAATAGNFVVGGTCADEGREITFSFASDPAQPALTALCTGGDWSVSPGFTGVSDGPITFRAAWTDDPAVHADVTLTLDRSHPDITITSPSDQDYLRGGSPRTVTWSVSATDLSSQSATIEYLNGPSWIKAGVTDAKSGAYTWTVPALDLSNSAVRVTVTDLAGNTSSDATPATLTIDSTRPGVHVQQHELQSADPTNLPTILFQIVFTEPIDPDTFTISDLTITGTASGITWGGLADEGDGRTFVLSTLGISSPGTITVSLDANKVSDRAGNLNTASSAEWDNTVEFDNVGPSVTISLSDGQADPVNTGPVRFDVEFSEPIDQASFTLADISNSGTAAISTWDIEHVSGSRKFVISTTPSTDGTVTPVINPGLVQDLAGNTNSAPSAGDGTVTFDTTLPDVSVATAEVPAGYVTRATQTAFTVQGACTAGDGNLTVQAKESASLTYPVSIDTAVCAGNGSWSASLDLGDLADGLITVRVSQTDAAGNVGEAYLYLNKDTAPPEADFAINGGVPTTASPFVTIRATTTDAENDQRYVTRDATCATGGSWEQADSPDIASWDLGGRHSGPRSVHAKFRDPLGNETDCLEATILLNVLDVMPAYSGTDLWNTYLKRPYQGKPVWEQDSDGIPPDPCAGNENMLDGCFHAGALRRVVTREPSCGGIFLQDSEDAFRWSCHVLNTGDGPRAVFHTEGFKPGKGLADLIAPSGDGFKEMYVNLTGGGGSGPSASLPTVWWKNHVGPAPVSSALSILSDTTDASGNPRHRIWTLPASPASGGGYNLNSPGIGLVVLPGGSYSYAGTEDNCDTSTGGFSSPDGKCVIASNAMNFLWIEGRFSGGTGNSLSAGIRVHESARSRLHRVDYTGSTGAGAGGDYGIYVKNGNPTRTATYLSDVSVSSISGATATAVFVQSSGAVLEHVSAANTANCVLVASTSATLPIRLKDIRATNCDTGIRLQGVSPVLSGALVSNARNAGIEVVAPDAKLSRVSVFNTSDSGHGVVFTTSSPVLHQFLSHGPSPGLLHNDSATLATVSEAAISRTDPEMPMLVVSSLGALKLTQHLLVSEEKCDDPGSSEVFPDCGTRENSSDHTVVSGLHLAGSFHGPLPSHAPDPVYGQAGPILFSSISKWWGFSTFFRMFGLGSLSAPSGGRCVGSEVCEILDWRLVHGDAQLLGRSTNPEGTPVLGFNPGEPCPVNGDEAVDDSFPRLETPLPAKNTWLRTATEILLDYKGDDDGLCESGEDCLFTPNYGAYQGEGDYRQIECHSTAFGSGKKIQGVRLFAHPKNGVLFPDTEIVPETGFGPSQL